MSGEVFRKQSWGFFKEKDDSIAAVLSNKNDIFECGFYNMAVIEEISEGIVGRCDECYWFAASHNDDKPFKPNVSFCSKPSKLKNVLRFSQI